ncbi:MAG: MazF family toxin-antitoxin system [Lactobacillaceae bacterium]|jgi:hypothetical protein|nr:MazF family toxin-antitoxin system [Lactobacillaceae bacterium]
MKTNELVTAYITFGDGSGGKRRPILILGYNDEVIIAYRLTTKYINKSAKIKEHYYKMLDWSIAGLKTQSYIDTSVKQRLSRHLIGRQLEYIGEMTILDINGLSEFIRNKVRRS